MARAPLYNLVWTTQYQLDLRSWTWRQTGMLGQDQLPVGDQVSDLTPKPAPRLPLYSTEWRQVGMLGLDRLPTGKQRYELTTERYTPFRLDETWVWRQVGMLGQDQLPVGDQIFDLTPKPPQRLPYYGTEWRQVGMLGMDQLPVGQIIYELPKGPYRIEQTWTWRQVTMLGQDTLPTGDQVSDLTPKAAPRLPLYSWEWRQIGMLGLDQLPVGDQAYNLTDRPWRLEQTWTINLQQTTLAPVVVTQQLIARSNYDLPGRAKPIEQTTAWNQTGMLGQDVLPKNQSDWPLPGRPYRIEQTVGWNQTPMFGQDQLPTGEQVSDLWPRTSKPIEQTWTWRQVDKLGRDILPKNQSDWPVPKAPLWWSAYRDWEWNQTPMLGMDQLPNNQRDWPNPIVPYRLEQTWTQNLQQTTLQPVGVPYQIIVRWNYELTPRAPKPIEQTWAWNQIPMLGMDALPFRQQDWPNPRAPFRIDQTTEWNQAPMLGQDRLPVGQAIYVLWTKAPPPIDQTWAWRQTIMLGKDILPSNQYDWPLPKAPRTTEYRTWEWRQVGMLGQDQLPTGAQVYDRPVPAPQRAAAFYEWIQSVNNELLNPAPAGPLGVVANQYDWPLTPAPRQAALGWAWRQVDKLGLDRLPKNQSDWPLPNRGPAPLTPSWAWRQVGMLGRDQLPTGKQVYDLTPKAPLRAVDLSNWIESVNLALFFPPAPLPFTVTKSSTALPDRGPFQPDRGFTYRSQFIPAAPIPPVGAQYFLLQPHYIFDRLLPAWTIVTEGVEIPFGWIPTLMVDPLNTQAVTAFYNAGPRPGYPGPGYDWQGFQFFTAQRQASIQTPATHWQQLPNGMFSLTGLGSALPPVGV